MKTVVVPVPSDSVSLNDVNPERIYILKLSRRLYKANTIDNGYAFIDLRGSERWSNGRHSSLQALIESTLTYLPGSVVYEFEDLREFAVWIYNNT